MWNFSCFLDREENRKCEQVILQLFWVFWNIGLSEKNINGLIGENKRPAILQTFLRFNCIWFKFWNCLTYFQFPWFCLWKCRAFALRLKHRDVLYPTFSKSFCSAFFCSGTVGIACAYKACSSFESRRSNSLTLGIVALKSSGQKAYFMVMATIAAEGVLFRMRLFTFLIFIAFHSGFRCGSL